MADRGDIEVLLIPAVATLYFGGEEGESTGRVRQIVTREAAPPLGLFLLVELKRQGFIWPWPAAEGKEKK